MRVNVKRLRDELGLSQENLAKELGVHRRTVQRWEIDTVDPSPLATRRLKEIHQARMADARTKDEAVSASDSASESSTRPTRRGFLPSVP